MSACDIVYGLYSTHILRQYLHIPKKNRRNRIPASIFEGRNNTPFLRVYEQQVCFFFKYFPQLCIKSRVIYGVLTTRPNILPRFRNQEIINIFPFFTSSFLPYGSLETGYTYNFKHRHK